MQTPASYDPGAAPAPNPPRCVIQTLAPRHRYLTLDEPLGDCKAVTVSAWVQLPDTRTPQWDGRSNVCIGAGPCRLMLSPSVAQLRALALLLQATADEQEMANAHTLPQVAA